MAALEYRVDGNNVSLFIIPEEAYRQLRLNDKPRFKVVSHRGYDVVIWRSQAPATRSSRRSGIGRA